MSLPHNDQLRDLLGWEPEFGVLSICLRIDRASRGHGWRIELKDELREGLNRIGDGRPHDEAQALRATAERALARYPEDSPPGDGRAHVGFVEVCRDGDGADRWFVSQAQPRRTYASFGPRPSLRRLIELIDDNRKIGVVNISGEEARMLEWDQGELAELERMEILTTGDWRDTKAPRSIDPAAAQAVGSSGHDQYDQRVEANRERFVGEVAERIATNRDGRGWEELITLGEDRYLSELGSRLPDRIDVVHSEAKNLISTPAGEIGERIGELVPEINRARERALIERVEDAAQSGGRGSLGLQETAQALVAGRVSHLVIDSERRFDPGAVAALLAYERVMPDVPPGELFIEQAVRTGAAVTPVEDDAAELLTAHEGIAALLRY